MTTRAPRYTERDRAELLALQLYRDGLCPLCGRPLGVCTSDEAAPDAPAFGTTWRVCRATRELIEKQRATYAGNKHPNRAAHLWGTTTRKG